MFKYLVEKLTTYWNTENDTPISWPQPLLAMVQQFRHHPGPPKQRRMEESRHRFIFWPPKCSHLTFTIHKGHSKFKPLRNNASIPTQNKYVYIYIHDSTCMYKYIDMHIHFLKKKRKRLSTQILGLGCWNTKNDTPISWPQPLLAMVQQFRHHPGPPKQRRMEERRGRYVQMQNSKNVHTYVHIYIYIYTVKICVYMYICSKHIYKCMYVCI